MDIRKIPTGKNPPGDLNVIVEIPLRGDPVKYEVDSESGAMYVHRFLHTAMYCPGNFGFIPHTLGENGEPLEILVLGKVAVAAGSVLRSRPIGVLTIEEEAGIDQKLLAVPHPKLHPFFDEVTSYDKLPPVMVRQIEHFFVHCKDAEVAHLVQVKGWGGPDQAAAAVDAAMKRAEKRK
jgi:inorganic pyrophosphatase